VRRSLRGLIADLEKDYPRVKESLLSAMGNIEADRLLDPRFLDTEGAADAKPDALQVLADSL
jgi:tRNA 2-thiocytidine biosynthesis protein TtcA